MTTIAVTQHAIIHNRNKYGAMRGAHKVSPKCYEWEHATDIYETKLDFKVSGFPADAFDVDEKQRPGLALKQEVTWVFQLFGPRNKRCGIYTLSLEEVFLVKNAKQAQEVLNDVHRFGFTWALGCTSAQDSSVVCRFVADVKSYTALVVAVVGGVPLTDANKADPADAAILIRGAPESADGDGKRIEMPKTVLNDAVGGTQNRVKEDDGTLASAHFHGYHVEIDHCKDYETLCKEVTPDHDILCGYPVDEKGKQLPGGWVKNPDGSGETIWVYDPKPEPEKGDQDQKRYVPGRSGVHGRGGEHVIVIDPPGALLTMSAAAQLSASARWRGTADRVVRGHLRGET